MISLKDELIHEFKKVPDWTESYTFNFIDKKNKIFGFVDISYLPKKNKLLQSYFLFIQGEEYIFSEETPAPEKFSGRTISHKELKYSLDSKNNEMFNIQLKNSNFDISLQVSAFHHIYDYPFAVETEVDEIREKYEALLWNRFEQRCKYNGEMKFKTGPKKGQTLTTSCFGQRDRQWGARRWADLNAYSLYYIQFRDYAFSLTFYDFGETILSNGFISKKSGNIPIYETELEHIDINPKDKFADVSEIFYKDSQGDKDLIVSKRIHSFSRPDMKYGSCVFKRFLNVSDFIIIGAQKKGTGFERHFIKADIFNKYTE